LLLHLLCTCQPRTSLNALPAHSLFQRSTTLKMQSKNIFSVSSGPGFASG